MTPKLDEPIGRHRWSPLVDVDQPLLGKKQLQPTESEDNVDSPDEPLPLA